LLAKTNFCTPQKELPAVAFLNQQKLDFAIARLSIAITAKN
jgi:hypothetical protein